MRDSGSQSVLFGSDVTMVAHASSGTSKLTDGKILYVDRLDIDKFVSKAKKLALEYGASYDESSRFGVGVLRISFSDIEMVENFLHSVFGLCANSNCGMLSVVHLNYINSETSFNVMIKIPGKVEG